MMVYMKLMIEEELCLVLVVTVFMKQLVKGIETMMAKKQIKFEIIIGSNDDKFTFDMARKEIFKFERKFNDKCSGMRCHTSELEVK